MCNPARLTWCGDPLPPCEDCPMPQLCSFEARYDLENKDRDQEIARQQADLQAFLVAKNPCTVIYRQQFPEGTSDKAQGNQYNVEAQEWGGTLESNTAPEKGGDQGIMPDHKASLYDQDRYVKPQEMTFGDQRRFELAMIRDSLASALESAEGYDQRWRYEYLAGWIKSCLGQDQHWRDLERGNLK